MASTNTPRGEPSLSLKILLVDDKAAVRSSFCTALGNYGHQVIAAPSAEECLDLLEQGNFDLALVDVELPGGADGLFLAARLNKKEPGLPVILYSGTWNDLDGETERVGARAFLEKPIHPKKLNAECARIVAEAKAELASSDPLPATTETGSESSADPNLNVYRALPREGEGSEMTLQQSNDNSERETILAALHECRWNRAATAAKLRISRSTLLRKMKILGITQ